MQVEITSLVIGFVLMLICSLISVAFLTLLERKLLGYVQLRKGPDKVGLWGVFQPFSDALKLFSKEYIIIQKINFFPFWLSPMFSLFISLVVWFSFPYVYILCSWKLSVLFMFCVLSLNVYSIMISGWSSNSSYATLGCIRSVAQSVSYEVSFFIMILTVIFFVGSFNLLEFFKIQSYLWISCFTIPLFFMMFVSMLAELNRTPFDFSEGESELVSGFNIEYGGTSFAFLFLSEYLSIIFSSFLLTLFFFNSLNVNTFFFIKIVFFSFFIILIRGSLPRYRYDKLMNLCWKSYLGCTLSFITFYLWIGWCF